MDSCNFFGVLSDSLSDSLSNLNDIFDRLADLCFKINDIPLLSRKKKPKYRQYPYQVHYIRSQVKMLKNLPYQRRIY